MQKQPQNLDGGLVGEGDIVTRKIAFLDIGAGGVRVRKAVELMDSQDEPERFSDLQAAVELHAPPRMK